VYGMERGRTINARSGASRRGRSHAHVIEITYLPLRR
jgi:hypothetical protein